MKKINKNNIHKNTRFKKACALVLAAAMVSMTAVTGNVSGVFAKDPDADALCGIPAHTHGSECYETVKTLVCGKEDDPSHEHTDECYEETQKLICELQEHEHTEECYIESGKEDADAAGGSEDRQPSCGKEEHEHTDECYETKLVLICQDEREEHVHDESCYEEQEILACGNEEHVHTEACYSDENAEAPDGSGDGENNNEQEKELLCGKEEHEHTIDCYETEDVIVCGQQESEEHEHTDECYKELEVLTCDKEAHKHTAACYGEEDTQEPEQKEDEEKELLCGKEEHQHTADCYEKQQVLICGKEENDEHTHTDECYEEQDVLICGKEEHTHTDECYEEQKTDQDLISIKDLLALVAMQGSVDCETNDGNVKVSGSGSESISITATALTDRSAYNGNKSVVFAYDISAVDPVQTSENSDSSNTDAFTVSSITVKDCGIMSDDDSLEIWKINDEGECVQINNDSEATAEAEENANESSKNNVVIQEGSVTFSANSFGKYIAVSDVTTVDLAKADVTITYSNFSGMQQDGTSISVDFSDSADKKYRVSQSNNENNVNYLINFPETDSGVVYASERTVIIDGINTSSCISIPAYKDTVNVKLLLRKMNQVHHIYYGTGGDSFDNYNKKSKLTIDAYNNSNDAELYVPYKMNKDDAIKYVRQTGGVGEHWSKAGIGGGKAGQYKACTGLTIAGGTICVYAQNANGATAIGGGGNADAQISITGGDITAICSSTGAAIGGGIGWVSRGGKADISISGGKVYAENIGWYIRDNVSYGGVAIGSGSSMSADASEAKIEISGNAKVTAYARYGNGIGSGNSYEKAAAEANITISGNSTVTTNALGGGTSKEGQGGSANITVEKNAKVDCVKYSGVTDKWDTSDENVLGAFGIGGGNSAGTYKGGSAAVTVNGGNLNCNGGKIGGGSATGTGNGGDASIYVTGGSIDCGSIGGGDSGTGAPGAVRHEKYQGVVVTNGRVTAGTIGGGTNQKNEVGFATAKIAGGTIQGQFILANSSKDPKKKCTFEMTGGTIDNSSLGSVKKSTADQTENSEGASNEGSSSSSEYNRANENGGAVYLTDPDGVVNISGGTITNCRGVRGGAIYMAGANAKVNISGGTITNCNADSGGAVYMTNGTFEMSKNGSVEKCSAKNGGGAYLEDGTLRVSGGSFNANTAEINGGGAYVADGKVLMFGGSFTGNNATGDGGAMYVSSSTGKAANVVIRSGSIKENTSGGNGAGIAVEARSGNASKDKITIGVCETHTALVTDKGSERTFKAFDYTDEYDTDGDTSSGSDSTDTTTEDSQSDNSASGASKGKTHNHSSCPVIQGNTATGNGGGIYMSSSAATLDIYCLEENNNTSQANINGGSIMTNGGTVTIGDTSYKGEGNETANGNITLSSPMLVSGGNVEIYGEMDNPYFAGNILVDIKNNSGKFVDHRTTKPKDDAGGSIVQEYYKVHYFENFKGDGQTAEGKYIAIQYDKDAEIKVQGGLYNHEGWKIIGWDTDQNATSAKFSIGSIIGEKDDHTAWGNNSNEELVLYAVWQRIQYTVKFDPNAPTRQIATGSMENQTFNYGETQCLNGNSYVVQGYYFTGWSTEKDGNVIYKDRSDGSKLTTTDNYIVVLYAQWTKCDHGDDSENHYLTYSFKNDNDGHGGTITEKCSHCGYTLSIKFTAYDTYYDGNYHEVQKAPASAESEFKGAIVNISYEHGTTDNDYQAMEDDKKPKQAGFYKATIKLDGTDNIENSSSDTSSLNCITLKFQIKNPTAGINCTGSIANGQKFSDFKEAQSAKIDPKGSFTVKFIVSALNKEVYTQSPKLKFGNGNDTTNTIDSNESSSGNCILPAGATIIMQTDNKYYYFKATDSKSEISLNEFTEMGSSGNFNYIANETQSYRFIVDCSNASSGMQTGKIELEYTPTGAQGNVTGSVNITASQSNFNVSAGDENKIKVSAPSADSFNKDQLVLVIKNSNTDENSIIPSDAILTVDGAKKYALNPQKEFVVPLEWGSGEQSLNVSLTSEMVGATDKSFDFTAELFGGNKSNGSNGSMLISAKTGGLKATSSSFNLKIPADDTPSLKLTATDSQKSTKRIFKKSDSLTLDISMQNNDSCSYDVKIQGKQNDAHSYDGTYLTGVATVNSGENTFSLGGIESPGSYRLLITMKKGDKSIEVPYYFIITS